MLSETLKNLASEFSLLEGERSISGIFNRDDESVDEKAKKNAELEKDVIGKLDRSVKFDEVDTVAFGLETDDGKIVKVYVNAEQGAEFEKALSAKLGEVDDIEQILNDLAKEFEIVDVDWPNENSEDADTSEEDGSEVMDKKVYKKDSDTDVEESLNFGEMTTLQLYENASSIENRFTTASQLMVYHAILDLGIPEISLARNPYRSAIIKGIKEKAIEIQNSASMKIALKSFIRRAIDFDEKAKENELEPENKVEVKDTKKPEPKDEKEVKENKIMVAEEKVEWSFTQKKDELSISCSMLNATFDPEETEKLLKGVSNRDAVVVRDSEDRTKKIIFSPRGSSILVKRVGGTDGYMMTSKDVDEMIDTISAGEKE